MQLGLCSHDILKVLPLICSFALYVVCGNTTSYGTGPVWAVLPKWSGYMSSHDDAGGPLLYPDTSPTNPTISVQYNISTILAIGLKQLKTKQSPRVVWGGGLHVWLVMLRLWVWAPSKAPWFPWARNFTLIA